MALGTTKKAVTADDVEKMIRQSEDKAKRPKSKQELAQQEVLTRLAELGAEQVADDGLTFLGDRFILPAAMEGRVDQAEQYLHEYAEQQETPFEITRTFNYRPYDVAAAFDRAMRKVFATGGMGKIQFSFFGVKLPKYRSVASGVGETIQVPEGQVELGLLGGRYQDSDYPATFTLGQSRHKEYGLIGTVEVMAPKKHRAKIEGFFKVMEEELRTGSLYRGKAITASQQPDPQFVDVSSVKPESVVYADEVRTQINVNLWSPIKYAAALRDAKVPLKRAVLLEGPNGTGKTLAGYLTAQIAEENGWTFILVRQGQDDALEALKTAQLYAPAVVWIEDLDLMANNEIGRAQIGKVLDILDNVQAKGTEVMAGFTSNFAEKLDKGVLRAGRLDAVIHVGRLDAVGYEQLVKVTVPERLLDPKVDYAKVSEAFSDFLPSFAAEAAQRAVRYSVARNEGEPGQITTDDLVNAAHGMKAHLELMDQAQHAGTERPPALDQALDKVVAASVAKQIDAAVPSLVRDALDTKALDRDSEHFAVVVDK